MGEQMADRFVIMGVMGCGKSTIGSALAARLSLNFIDGDDLHPQTNVEKMARGEALNDEDRWGWLEEVGRTLRSGGAIIACSALKRRYRDVIRSSADEPICFIWLNGSRETLLERVSKRPGHFMPASLLDSQLATLEPLESDECFLEANIQNDASSIVEDLITKIKR